MKVNKHIVSSGWLWYVSWTYTCVKYTHIYTHTPVVVIPVFPLPALLHMHEAQAMCEAAHCQPGWKRELPHLCVCASLSSSTLYLSDWATASHTHTNWERDTRKHMHILTHMHINELTHTVWALTHTQTYFYLMLWAVMMTGIKIEKHIRGTGG